MSSSEDTSSEEEGDPGGQPATETELDEEPLDFEVLDGILDDETISLFRDSPMNFSLEQDTQDFSQIEVPVGNDTISVVEFLHQQAPEVPQDELFQRFIAYAHQRLHAMDLYDAAGIRLLQDGLQGLRPILPNPNTDLVSSNIHTFRMTQRRTWPPGMKYNKKNKQQSSIGDEGANFSQKKKRSKDLKNKKEKAKRTDGGNETAEDGNDDYVTKEAKRGKQDDGEDGGGGGGGGLAA